MAWRPCVDELLTQLSVMNPQNKQLQSLDLRFLSFSRESKLVTLNEIYKSWNGLLRVCCVYSVFHFRNLLTKSLSSALLDQIQHQSQALNKLHTLLRRYYHLSNASTEFQSIEELFHVTAVKCHEFNLQLVASDVISAAHLLQFYDFQAQKSTTAFDYDPSALSHYEQLLHRQSLELSSSFNALTSERITVYQSYQRHFPELPQGFLDDALNEEMQTQNALVREAFVEQQTNWISGRMRVWCEEQKEDEIQHAMTVLEKWLTMDMKESFQHQIRVQYGYLYDYGLLLQQQKTRVYLMQYGSREMYANISQVQRVSKVVENWTKLAMEGKSRDLRCMDRMLLEFLEYVKNGHRMLNPSFETRACSFIVDVRARFSMKGIDQFQADLEYLSALISDKCPEEREWSCGAGRIQAIRQSIGTDQVLLYLPDCKKWRKLVQTPKQQLQRKFQSQSSKKDTKILPATIRSSISSQPSSLP